MMHTVKQKPPFSTGEIVYTVEERGQPEVPMIVEAVQWSVEYKQWTCSVKSMKSGRSFPQCDAASFKSKRDFFTREIAA